MADLDSVEKAKTQIDRQIKEFEKGHKPDSPVSVATMARVLQDNSELAEEIAERLGGSDWSYCSGGGIDCQVLEEIFRKVSCLRDYGRLDFEDLDKKLELVLRRLDQIGGNRRGD